jgi:aldehyde:ferredoxin oxidoreductase
MSSKPVDGYAGKILRVDLTSESLTEIVYDEETLKKWVGGTALGAKILYDEVDPKIDWSDPENRLIFASGPLGGTRIGGSGSVSVVTKGALTNGGAATQANGYFGAFMKFSGYDAIVIQGMAKRWRYLYVEDGKAELKEASHLLRRDTYETADKVKEENKKTEFQASVASIGPAGENLSRFAAILIDRGHAAGHNGTGAVMGSKRLKAICVARGSHIIYVKDPQALAEVADKLHENVKAFTGTVGGVYRNYKTGDGTLPVKNYLTNVWEVDEDEAVSFSEQYIRSRFNPRPHPCWACRLTHATIMTIPEGPYQGTLVEEPEYEQLAAWGPVILNKDINGAAMLSMSTDRLGLENNEAGWLMAWVMECYEKGFITKDDLGGLEMRWGNVEAVRQLLHMVAHRVGFGNILAEGVKRASERLGGEASRCAIYTLKGNTPRGHDHRTRWTEMFETCVSNTGTLEIGGWMDDPKLMHPGYPMEVSTNAANINGIMVFEDSLVTCRFNTRMNLPLLTKALNAVTGWNIMPEEAKAVGLRAVNLLRAFNLRAGIGAELDRPSERYGSTPVDGPWKGISIKPYWEKMLENYYSLMGWDVKTGVPLPETLRKLGLDYVVKDLW